MMRLTRSLLLQQIDRWDDIRQVTEHTRAHARMHALSWFTHCVSTLIVQRGRAQKWIEIHSCRTPITNLRHSTTEENSSHHIITPNHISSQRKFTNIIDNSHTRRYYIHTHRFRPTINGKQDNSRSDQNRHSVPKNSLNHDHIHFFLWLDWGGCSTLSPIRRTPFLAHCAQQIQESSQSLGGFTLKPSVLARYLY